MFTFAAAAQVGAAGKVLAVEPDFWLVRLMRRSSLLPDNARLNIELVHAAVCDAVGTAAFALARRGRATSHLAAVRGSSQSGGVAQEMTVPAVTLDSLLDQHPAPRFVKIDVEGAERLVLKGAARLLQVVRPTIYCEVSADCADEVTALLRENRYGLFDPHADPALANPLYRAAWNTLAFPGPTGAQ